MRTNSKPREFGGHFHKSERTERELSERTAEVTLMCLTELLKQLNSHKGTGKARSRPYSFHKYLLSTFSVSGSEKLPRKGHEEVTPELDKKANGTE